MDASVENGGSGAEATPVGKYEKEASESVDQIHKPPTTEKADVEMKKKKKKKKSRVFVYRLPRIGCLRVEKDGDGNFDMEVVDDDGTSPNPTHLVIMVNGIIGSAQNWKFAAKQFLKRYPRDVVVHCSERNYATLTLDGVDIMGDRLADEVVSVIERHPSLKKISFIGHSLGGLIARYAIGKLYGVEPKKEVGQDNAERKNEADVAREKSSEGEFSGKIAGLEPINFITSATPHLGSRWHKQVPMFCGSSVLEKTAARLAWLLGRSGRHLFLTDGDKDKPPLLLQMVRDTEDLRFMSALHSFKRRVAYANARFDCILQFGSETTIFRQSIDNLSVHLVSQTSVKEYETLVGWSTSSLRRRQELPKRRHLKRDDKYPHIVHMDPSKTSSPPEVIPDTKDNGREDIYMEEEMLRSLTKMSWERVDVSFSGSRQRIFAHNTIQVKSKWMNSDGADVIQHMVDNFLL
ncbi:unnamed protein product [Linum tenue]|uniref:DUF676 domain-containing protein n=1 Tax=Linum tenue TaxID=586396 RepID=A0AAV0NZU9_9ROSI|nr:unnamed protein product [Linum tenue]